MDPQDAQIALQFLQRVNLQPAEIQAFQQCCMALQGVVRAAGTPQPEAYSNPTPDEAA